MSQLQDWVSKNNYQIHQDSRSFLSDGAMEMDSLKGADELSNHVSGNYMNQDFEMIEKKTRKRKKHGGYSETEQTLVLFPNSCAGISDFEVIPGILANFLNFIGHGGVIFELAENAQRSSKEMIEKFNKNYKLFPGGVIESGLNSHNVREDKCENVDDIAPLCKTDFFEFFNNKQDLIVEVQGDHLMIHQHNKSFNHSEPNEILELGHKLIQTLYSCHRDQPIRGLSLSQKAFNPKAIFGKLALVAGVMFVLMATLLISAAFVGPRVLLAFPIIILIGGSVIFKTIFKAKSDR
ncbi:hypothetical protein LNTAR_23219 [Lentisphaera araneosa HTCC2155]|uniref:Uncharacterized protein n=1 Tax=Lentisphaera araneosa HTCC2155 TaxID=313628 RepID=A6DGN5_9BACT|nr:hypothetical protein [Lentisphaera araneosa]EDM29352.1 hypothetical protein LNTAR_23219 [Lentisphaera araneosa HTCC2155]